MVPSHFPLGEGRSWTHAVIEPFACTLILTELRPQVTIEVADMLTGERRSERAWVFQQTWGGSKLHYILERDGGVQILREQRFGKPETSGIVVMEDLRWAGETTWSHPKWHYSLGTIRYRRVGEEEVIVTAGAFRCVKILVEGGASGVVWLAPDVGIVRSAYVIDGPPVDIYSVAELHSYMPRPG